jgi:hypothetical protein
VSHHHKGAAAQRVAAWSKQLQDSRVHDKSRPALPIWLRRAQRRRLDSHARRVADFETLSQALDYAAQGRRGLNFHDARGNLTRTYPYSELREDALANARRFIALGIGPATGSR